MRLMLQVHRARLLNEGRFPRRIIDYNLVALHITNEVCSNF